MSGELSASEITSDYPALTTFANLWAVSGLKQPEAVRAYYEIDALRAEVARLRSALSDLYQWELWRKHEGIGTWERTLFARVAALLDPGAEP